MKQNEIWQVQVQGQIYESDFDQLTDWIKAGSVTSTDLVKRGSLRWLAAGKVPALMEFFNSNGEPVERKPFVSTTAPEQGQAAPDDEIPSVVSGDNFNPEAYPANYPAAEDAAAPVNAAAAGSATPAEQGPKTSHGLLHCHFHREYYPEYICGTCNNVFCSECPQFGETEEITCPVCAGSCGRFEPREEEFGLFESDQTFPVPPPPAEKPEFMPDEVLSGANWFFWIAGLTLINSIIILSGFDWAFVLGMAFNQIFDVGMSVIGEAATGEAGFGIFHFAALVLDVFVVSFFCMLGYFARKGAKWAFITGMVLYGLDTFLTLLTFSFIGIAIHLFALYCIYRGYTYLRDQTPRGG